MSPSAEADEVIAALVEALSAPPDPAAADRANYLYWLWATGAYPDPIDLDQIAPFVNPTSWVLGSTDDGEHLVALVRLRYGLADIPSAERPQWLFYVYPGVRVRFLGSEEPDPVRAGLLPASTRTYDELISAFGLNDVFAWVEADLARRYDPLRSPQWSNFQRYALKTLIMGLSDQQPSVASSGFDSIGFYFGFSPEHVITRMDEKLRINRLPRPAPTWDAIWRTIIVGVNQALADNPTWIVNVFALAARSVHSWDDARDQAWTEQLWRPRGVWADYE